MSIAQSGHLTGALLADAKMPSLRANSVRRNAVWMLLGNVATAAAQCGITVVLSKLGSEYIQGRFSLCMNIAAPLSIFLALNLRALILTDVTGQFSFHEYLAVRLATCLLMVPAGLTIGLWLWFGGRYDLNFVWVLGAVTAFKAVEWISDLCQTAFQKRQRMEFAAISQAVRAGLVLVATGIVMFATGSLLAVCLTWLLVATVMVLGYDLRTTRRFYELWGAIDLRRAFSIVRQSAPLVVTMVLLSVNANISSYVIAAYCSEAEVGYFAAMNYVVQALALVFVAIGAAAMPRMAEHYQSQPAALWTLLAKAAVVVVAIGAVAFAGSLALGHWFLRTAYLPQYAEHVGVLWVLTGGSVLLGLTSLTGFAGTACRAFRSGIVVWGIVSAVTLAGGLWLVPRWGIAGAAWSNFVSNAVALALMVMVVVMATRRRRSALRAAT